MKLWGNLGDLVLNQISLVTWIQFSSLTFTLSDLLSLFFWFQSSAAEHFFLSLNPQYVSFLVCMFLYFSNVSVKVQKTWVWVSSRSALCKVGVLFFEKASELLYCVHMARGESLLCSYAFFVLRKTPMYPAARSEGYSHLSPVLQRWGFQ